MWRRVGWLGTAALMVAAVGMPVAGLTGASPAAAATVHDPAGVQAAAGVPGAPTAVTGVPGDQGAVVSWTAPSSTGGSPVTGYVINASPGGKSVHTSAGTSFQVGGLTDGTAYTFTVAAVNQAGTGLASSPSPPLTPTAPTVPGAPRSVTAAAGFQQVTVSWAVPASDGGAPINGYRITTSPATSTVTVAASTRSAVVAGLADGTGYRVRVTAVNSVGAGKTAASASVTPNVTVPSAPVGVTAAPTASGVKVGWQPPASDGGSAISGYVITVTGTSTTVTAVATARSVTITGLTAGTPHTFTVAAKNAKGQGPVSASTPATAGASVQAKTVVLSAASLTKLTTVGTDGSLIFTSPPAQVSGLAVGDIVAAGVSAATPDGLLASVTSVSSAGSTVTVGTTPASLDQALASAGFGATTGLTSGQVAAFRPALPGVRLMTHGPASASPGSISLSLDTDLYKDKNGRSVNLSGSITLTPSMSFWASITCCTHTASKFTGTVTASASLALKAELSHDIGGGYTLGTLRFSPITFAVAGVPVVIVPELTVKVIAQGTVTAGLSAGGGASVTVGAQVSSSDSTVTAQPVFSSTTSWDPPTLYGTVDAAAGAEADLSATVDGLQGPDLTDSLWLAKLSADPSQDPWWTLSAENVIAIDYQLKLLDDVLASYDKTLSDNTVELAHAPGPYQQITIIPSPAVVLPGGQLQFQAQVGGAAAQNVTWNAPTGSGTITSAGLYTAPSQSGTYEITAAQAAAGLKPPAYGLVSIQVGRQPPGAPTNPAATSASCGAATVGWTPPADTGGGAITGYTVIPSPGGQPEQALGTATSATVLGLTPGGTYTFAVTATSHGGTSLPSPATSPVVVSNTGKCSTWVAAKAPLPSGAAANPGVTISSVSCGSANTCAAGGNYLDSAGNQQGLLLTRSGTSWTVTKAPLPADAAAAPGAAVTSVSCVSATACTAVGYYTNSSNNQQGLLLTWAGTSWTALRAPQPAGGTGGELNSVDCVSATACTAVGDGSTLAGGLIVTGSGTSWTATTPPVPSGGWDEFLESVSCASAASCTAVGSYHSDSPDWGSALLITGSGTSWTTTPAPLPPHQVPPGSTPDTYLTSVSCATTTACTATGGFIDNTGFYGGLIDTGSGAFWTPTRAPLPAGATPESSNVVLHSVACPTATACTVTGQYPFESGLLDTGSGTSWTPTKAPLPADYINGNGVYFNSVSCTSATACTAAGEYGGNGVLLSGFGTSWIPAKAPLPPDAANAPYVALGSVSCTSATACTAIGSYTDSAGNTQGLLLIHPG